MFEKRLPPGRLFFTFLKSGITHILRLARRLGTCPNLINSQDFNVLLEQVIQPPLDIILLIEYQCCIRNLNV